MYFLLAYLLLKILLYTLFNEDKSEEKAKYIIILFLVSKIFKIFFFSVKASCLSSSFVPALFKFQDNVKSLQASMLLCIKYFLYIYI